MKQFGKLAKDKRGSTLIEIVVSVLIVGIAFVPLMMALNTALTTNRETEKKLYAEEVASNVIELCKTYGANGLYDMSDATIESKKIGAIFEGATLPKPVGGKAQFEIKGISSGIDSKFNVSIDFSTAEYDAKSEDDEEPDEPGVVRQNDFSQYPSLSGISDARTVRFGYDSLESIVGHFFSHIPEPDVTEQEMLDNVDKWLKREIHITVSLNSDSGKYIINRSIVYKATKDIPGDTTGIGKVGDKVIFKNMSQADLDDLEYSSQSGDVGAGKATFPSNIVLTYEPVKKISKDDEGNVIYESDGTTSKKSAVRIYDDKIIINKESSGRMNVYCVREGGAAVLNANSSIKVEAIGTDLNEDAVPDTSGETTPSESGAGTPSSGLPYDPTKTFKVRVFSNVMAHRTKCDVLNEFGESSGSKQSKLKDVTVTVYEVIGEGDVIERLKQKSTIIEFE